MFDFFKKKKYELTSENYVNNIDKRINGNDVKINFYLKTHGLTVNINGENVDVNRYYGPIVQDLYHENVINIYLNNRSDIEKLYFPSKFAETFHNGKLKIMPTRLLAISSLYIFTDTKTNNNIILKNFIH
jgi:hypothetical protein